MFDREKLVLETVHIRKREFIEQPKHIVYAADTKLYQTHRHCATFCAAKQYQSNTFSFVS